MVAFKLLGQVVVTKNGELLQHFRSQKELALLIYLAHNGQPQRRELIAELLWESRSSEQALSNLRTAITRLQKQVGDALVIAHRSLDLTPEARQRVDSVHLLRVLAETGPIGSAVHADTLERALATYHGDFLADLRLRNAPRFDEWAMTVREQLRHEVLAAYHRLGQHVFALGDAERGVALARRWLLVDQLDEHAHSLLLRSLIAAGNTREALAHYESCTVLLRTELGIAPPEAMTALIQTLRQLPSTAVRLDVSARHNLPVVYDQFFGREQVQHELQQRLDQPWCRLVTIVGLGGVGKTRLATTIARRRLDRYPDGVWLVELAGLDPQDDNLAEAIAVEIATVLDLRFVAAVPPAEQLLGYLQQKQLLLVLDNLEQLLGGMQIVLDILQRCERVQLLVTSREPLQLRAEWIVALQGLTYPRSDADATHADAVELFAARRAQQQWAGLSDEDLVAMRTICRMVEGLPLAIELAAAVTRTIAPRAVAERLEQNLDLLATTLRDLPPRHHSLQIVFDMSWRTLNPALQGLLPQLAVFCGGFSAVAAQQVAGADTQQLAALVEKSLIRRSETFERYTLHAVVRAYAAEKLPPGNGSAQQHARYYLGLLAQHTEPLQGSRPQVSVGTLEVEFDNLRLAWQTGVAGRKADWLATGLTSLSLLYQLRGLAREGEAVMQATAMSAATWGSMGSALATRAGLEQARFQNRLGRYWQATVTLATALRLAAQNGDRWAEAMGHVLWGEALWRLGEHEAARAKLAHALELGQMLDAQLIVGWCHHHFGIIDDIQGRYDAAHEHLQRACAAWQSLENATTLSVSLNSIGLVRHHQGDLAAAREIMEQALTLCTQIDNRHLQALLLNNLSMVATESDDYAGAQHYLQLGLELAVATGNLTGQGEIYANLGKNYWLLGKTALAAENLEQGLRVAEILGNRFLIATMMLYLAQVKHAQGISESVATLYNQALLIARQDALSHLECELLLGLADFLSATNRMQAQLYSLEARALAETLGNARLLERATTVAYELHLPLHATKQNLSA